MLRYKGYTGKAEVDIDAGILHGEVLGTRDVITFQADSIEGLEKEFMKSINFYLEVCESRGEYPDKPYSGKFVLRLSPEQHRAVAFAAQHANTSLNAWVTQQLLHAVESELGNI